MTNYFFCNSEPLLVRPTCILSGNAIIMFLFNVTILMIIRTKLSLTFSAVFSDLAPAPQDFLAPPRSSAALL